MKSREPALIVWGDLHKTAYKTSCAIAFLRQHIEQRRLSELALLTLELYALL